MKILFIGGPANGEWREVEYLQPELHALNKMPVPSVRELDDIVIAVPFNHVVYRLEKLIGRFGTHYVYLCQDGQANRCAIEAILEGYKP